MQTSSGRLIFGILFALLFISAMPTYTSADGICGACIESIEAANLNGDLNSTSDTDPLDGATAPVVTTLLSAGQATSATEFQSELISPPEPCYYSRAPPPILA